MTLPTSDEKRYRPAAGIAIFNKAGQVWLGKRSGKPSKYCWQFPQGGIDPGEDPKSGAFRELWEETGLKPEHVELLAELDPWLYYDFPAEYITGKAAKGFTGQRQKWFAVRLISSEKHFDLKAHMPIEFSEWRWGELSNAPELIVPFKRKVYERLASEFEPFAKPVK